MMKKKYLFLWLLIFSFLEIGCVFTPRSEGESNTMSDLKQRIDTVHQVYPLGYLNQDKKLDTAFISYTRKIDSDKTILTDCAFRNCEIEIQFSDSIPPILMNSVLHVWVEKAVDINSDGCDEILVFSNWMEQNWKTVQVYSLQNNSWKLLGSTKAFISEDADEKNRIIQINKKFYLLGDIWSDGVMERKDTIKLFEK